MNERVVPYLIPILMFRDIVNMEERTLYFTFNFRIATFID